MKGNAHFLYLLLGKWDLKIEALEIPNKRGSSGDLQVERMPSIRSIQRCSKKAWKACSKACTKACQKLVVIELLLRLR